MNALEQDCDRAAAVVFVSGSRSLSAVPEYMATRLDSCRAAGHRILIGDACGVDAWARSRLALEGHRDVLIYHSGKQPRHNESNWAAVPVVPPTGAHGFALHAAKDRAMASSATHALAFWDGHSPGTLLNVLRMSSMSKPTVVGLVHESRFLVVRDAAGLKALLSIAPCSARAAAESRATPAERAVFQAALAGNRPEPSRGRFTPEAGMER